MNSELIKKHLPSKKDKLETILDWVAEHCDQHQREQISQLINKYDFLKSYPAYETMQVSHATDFLTVPPTREQFQKSGKGLDFVDSQIRKRKMAINRLYYEIEEYKNFKR